MLDTHVVLDWLVFRNAGVQPLGRAVESGSPVWIACATTRAELDRVLASRRLAGWSPDRVALLSLHDRLARAGPEPDTDPVLRCRDADDQVFVDLARARRARWLLTRDRDLLALARRARATGLEIVTPERWAADWNQGGAFAPIQVERAAEAARSGWADRDGPAGRR